MKIGILGGGLAGLTLANFLKHDFELLEKNEECGGLCRSFQEEGFTFDYGGGHILFSKNERIIDFVKRQLRGNLVKCRRNTKIFFKGRYVKYPFENGLSDLPPKDASECLYYFIQNWIRRERGQLKKPKNAREWIYYTFGKGIAEKYLIPYNEKIWQLPPEQMSLSWIGGRVPQPPVEDVVKSALGIPTEGYLHQLYFHYPKKGGIQSLIKGLEKAAGGRVTLNFEVRSVKKEDGKWIVSDGRREKRFDKIVSTIPIQDFCDAYRDTPKEVKVAADSLRYNSLITVCLGLNMEKLNDISWLYFPHKENGMFHRASFPFNYSPHVVPEGKSSVVVELTCDFGGKLWREKNERLIEHVVGKLHDNKVIDKGKVCFSKVKRTRYAYVVHDLNYDRSTKIFRDFFREEGVGLCGRFSEFKYLNMDATMQRAIATAEKLNAKR